MENTHTNTENVLLSWEASSYPDHKRSARWYYAAGVITLAITAYSLITSSWTMTVAVLLAAGVYFLMRDVPHERHKVEIIQEGIRIDGGLVPWSMWDSFWILVGKDYAELHIAPKRGKKIFRILNGDVEPMKIRDAVGQFLPQDDQKRERIFDIIIRICKL